MAMVASETTPAKEKHEDEAKEEEDEARIASYNNNT